MRLLLDTHILIWAVNGSEKLSPKMQQAILSTENDVFYSVVSIWECAIKHRLYPKEISSGREVSYFAQASGFRSVLLAEAHVHMLDTLQYDPNAPRHKDPFDRMLIAQAKAEGLRLLTHDKKISFYNEPCILSL